MTTVTVPHDGEGTHTLLVAVEVDDRLLCDPAQHRRIVAAVTARASSLLSDLTVIDTVGEVVACG